MARTSKPKATAQKKAKGAEESGTNSRSKKPLHEALGPAAKDFGQEIKPLGKEVGGLTVRAVRSLLIKPLSTVVWGLDSASEWISNSVSEKLSNKKPEELKEPDPRIALPTLQALIYSGGDEAVREMFSNLLATEMTKESSSKAHPSFVELIKQMTAEDAKVMSHIASDTGQARLEVRLAPKDNYGVFYTIANTLTFMAQDPTPTSGEDLLVALSNIERLGLVRIDESKYPNNDLCKNSIKNIKENFEDQVDKEKFDLMVHAAGIYITPLGERFVKVCLPDAVPAIQTSEAAPPVPASESPLEPGQAVD